jgi:hypothetical protein
VRDRGRRGQNVDSTLQRGAALPHAHKMGQLVRQLVRVPLQEIVAKSIQDENCDDPRRRRYRHECRLEHVPSRFGAVYQSENADQGSPKILV